MPLTQICDHGGNNYIATIRTGRLFDGDMSDSADIVATKRANAEIGLKFAECSRRVSLR